MAALTRSDRVFDAVFPPGESPLLPGYVPVEKLRPEQQRLWNVVTRVLQPDIKKLGNDITEGETSSMSCRNY